MRAKEFLEQNNYIKYYNILKKVIDDLSPLRKVDYEIESYYVDNLFQDFHKEVYLSELKEWEINKLDESLKPVYYENILGIPHEKAAIFRIYLFSVIEDDKSFGYLYCLLAEEMNRTEPKYIRNPLNCIPDDKLIEESVFNYQDDYPKPNLEAYLTYCDFNYSFYKANNIKSQHTQDLWYAVFTDAYSLFDNLRIKMLKPFLACDILKEHFNSDKTNVFLIVKLLSELLQQYDYDLTDEQKRCKTILVDEIQSYLDSLKNSEVSVVQAVQSTQISTQTTSENVPINPTKSITLKNCLTEYGFFELEKVKNLSEQSQLTLVDKLATKGIPFAIAMFDYLEFFKWFNSQYHNTNKKRNIEIASWFNSNDRTIRGNIDSLLKASNDKNERYTAHTHKENVKITYEQLKGSTPH